MEERPNYYAVIPADVRYDKDLKDKAKLLYGEIVSLSNKNGYCFASNKYFAKLYDVSITTISLLIKNLVDKGYIESQIIYKEGTKEILNRYLSIVKEGYLKNLKGGIKENLKDNNININNTSINNNIRFIKPTVEEIKKYCNERKNNIDAEAFYDFYESKNWYVGKNKMKDWQACIRTWEKRNKVIYKDIVPEWFDKEIKGDELTDEQRREFEAIKNGTYRA